MSLHEIGQFLGDVNHLINDSVLGAAGAWWVLPVIFILCFIDGFFPVVPSESLIVALAAVWAGWGIGPLTILALVGAAGAICGDQIAYRIGRKVGVHRWAWMSRPKIRKVFDMAERQLTQRGAVLIFTARYIPIGRVAVNFTAGATGYSLRRFTFFDILGCVLWGFYSVAIGTLAGQWMEHNKLLAIVVSVAIAIVVGWVLDRLIHRVLLRFRPDSSVLDDPYAAPSEAKVGDRDSAAEPGAEPITKPGAQASSTPVAA